MRIAFAALLLVSLQAGAADTALHPDDFAYGMTLQDGHAGAIYSLEIPEEVYRHVTRPDLGDLRIFNGDGEVVPYQLQKPRAAEQSSQLHELPFFPLFAEADRQRGETTLRIVPDSKGALIDLRSRSAVEANKVVDHYIVDASALDNPIKRLLLRWEGKDETFVADVRVETSDDLNHWYQTATGSLAELLYAGHHLQRNEIALDSVHAKYLRISWPLGEKRVILQSVVAEVSLTASEPSLHWSVAQTMADSEPSGRYLFDANGYYPVERLDVALPELNSLVQAQIFSSDDVQSGPWLPVYRGILFSLQVDGQSLNSGKLNIARSSHRYWRLDVDQRSGGLGAGKPQFMIGWRPQRLLFVARGKGPFTLAFGSARAEPLPSNSDLQGVLDSLQEGVNSSALVKSVRPAALRLLGGVERLRPLPPPLPWQKWLLWSVLIAGVIAMLLMARSLYRQMAGTKSM